MASDYSHAINELLGGEMSAVETYNLALKKTFDEHTRESLSCCRASHVDRVEKLKQCVIDAGGKPNENREPWDIFAALVEHDDVTDQDALAALEELEAEQLFQYEVKRENAPPSLNRILSSALLPAQQDTHLILSVLSMDATASKPRQ